MDTLTRSEPKGRQPMGWWRLVLALGALGGLMGNFTGGCQNQQDTWEIFAQPKATTSVSGDAASFNVGVYVWPLSDIKVRWQKNGVDVPGATEPSVLLPTTLADDGAVVRAVASSADRGDLVSDEVKLAVVPWRFRNDTPRPIGRTSLAVGQSETFKADVERTSETVTFQWLRNGQPIAGATNDSYVLGPVSFADQAVRIAVQVSHPLLTRTSFEVDVTITN